MYLQSVLLHSIAPSSDRYKSACSEYNVKRVLGRHVCLQSLKGSLCGYVQYVQAGLCGCVRGGTGRSVWVCPWAYRQVCVGVSIDVQAGLCVGVSMDVQAGLCGCVH